MASGLLELNLRPDAPTLRRFGFIALAGFGLLALCAYAEVLVFGFGLGPSRLAVSGAFAAIGVTAGLLSLVYPAGNRPIWVVLTLVSFPIGFVLSHVVMVVLFFAVFAPIGALLRALGKDPIERGASQDAKSYWQQARPARNKERYFRQF